MVVENCEKHLTLRSLKGTGGSASADHVSGAKYPQNFKKIIGDNGYLSHKSLTLMGQASNFSKR
jgi:hypothetical protein